MSLEGILAEFEQLRQESERALQGKEVPVTSLGDVAILDVDVSAVPPAPQLQCSGLGVELELVGLSQSSPDRPLRGLAVQVEAARLSQDDELERRSAKLEEIKGELGKYGRARLKLRREVGSLMLEVSRRQSTLAAMAEEGGHLQEAISRLMAEVVDMRARLADQTQLQLANRRLYSKYSKKMDSYECQFVSVQCGSPAAAEVAALRETLAGLAQKRAELLKGGGVDVLSGQKTEGLKAALEDVRGRAAAALARRQEAKELVASHRQKRDKVVQASNLLKKRNQAQLLRVKRQLQECHAHKRRWAEEASRLQATISQFKGDIGHKPRN